MPSTIAYGSYQPLRAKRPHPGPQKVRASGGRTKQALRREVLRYQYDQVGREGPADGATASSV